MHNVPLVFSVNVCVCVCVCVWEREREIDSERDWVNTDVKQISYLKFQ